MSLKNKQTIVTIPAPTLREQSKELQITELQNNELQEFMHGLIPTMYAYEGIGIAATQVGVNLRICVIGKAAFPKRHPLAGEDLILVNPEWKKIGRKTQIEPVEGCLSVPGSYGPVKRLKDIEVSALNYKGEHIQFEAHGFLARVIQHEVDHMNGILYIDRADELIESEHVSKIAFEIIQENVNPIL